MMAQERGAESGTRPVRHGEASEKTYLVLRELIVTGRLPPGAPATETQLAERLGVSRTPVRAAIARLALEGYLDPKTEGRRIEHVVAPLTVAAMTELWNIIGALEGLALGTIDRLGADERARLVAELRRINRELEAATEAKPRDLDRVAELQSTFHQCFMDRCAGRHLRTIYDGVRPHVRRYEWAYGTRSDAPYAPSLAEHRDIIRAIERADGASARTLVVEHWARASRRTAAIIERLGSPDPSAETQGEPLPSG